MNLAMLTAVFCCLFMKAPARKCLLYVLMVFRFLANSLTTFGNETVASVACELFVPFPQSKQKRDKNKDGVSF